MRTWASGAEHRAGYPEPRGTGALHPRPRADLHLSAMINAAGLSALLWFGLYRLVLG